MTITTIKIIILPFGFIGPAAGLLGSTGRQHQTINLLKDKESFETISFRGAQYN